jgi:hypothetical protein
MCFFLLSVLLFSGCIITGKVSDEDGNGIEGVTVTLTGDATLTTTTNSKGGYLFGNFFECILGFTSDDLVLIMPGTYTVTPSKAGYTFSPISTEVTVTSECYGPLAADLSWPVGGVNFLFVRDCLDISGNWSDFVTSEVSVTVLGETYTENASGIRTVSISQNDCNVDWFFTDDGVHYTRSGNVQGNVVYLSGECSNASALESIVESELAKQGLNVEVSFSTNTHTGQGTISGNTITYIGSGSLLGSFTYMGGTYSISASVPENSSLTRTHSLTSMSLENNQMDNSTPSISSTAGLLIEMIKKTVGQADN